MRAHVTLHENQLIASLCSSTQWTVLLSCWNWVNSRVCSGLISMKGAPCCIFWQQLQHCDLAKFGIAATQVQLSCWAPRHPCKATKRSLPHTCHILAHRHNFPAGSMTSKQGRQFHKVEITLENIYLLGPPGVPQYRLQH